MAFAASPRGGASIAPLLDASTISHPSGPGQGRRSRSRAGVDGVARDMTCVEPADDASFLRGQSHWVDVAVEAWFVRVRPGQGVEVLEGPVAHELDLAADLHVARRVVRVDDEQAGARVAEQVATLLPLEGGVDPGALAVGVEPHEARLRPAAGVHRREDAADPAVEQVEVRAGTGPPVSAGGVVDDGDRGRGAVDEPGPGGGLGSSSTATTCRGRI